MKKTVPALFASLLLLTCWSASANEGAGLSAQAQLFMQLQQMQKEIAELRGLVEEQQNRLERLAEDSKDRYQALDSRLSAANVHNGQPETVTSQDSTPAAPAVEPGDPAKEQQYYEAAYSLIQARDFGRAQQAFNAFLGRYPQGKFAANAHYWLGEIGLVEDNLQMAGRSFATVIESWPEHSKVPDSTYKLAVVEQRMGRFERAEALFSEVIERFPNSSAANLARQGLQAL